MKKYAVVVGSRSYNKYRLSTWNKYRDNPGVSILVLRSHYTYSNDPDITHHHVSLANKWVWVERGNITKEEKQFLFDRKIMLSLPSS
jgi:hypothetical protein